MADEFTEALCRAKKEAVYRRPMSDEEWQKIRETSTHPLDQWIALAVARVALERAAAHLRAEAAATIAGLKTSEDRDTSHLVIGLLRSMADDVEGLIPKETT